MSSTVGVLLTERSAVMLQVGTPGTIWKGRIPMILGLLGPLVYGFPLAFLLVRLAAPLFGATPGQLLLGIALAPSDPSFARGAPSGRRGLRFALEHAEWIGLVAGLASGRWEVTVCGIAGGAARLLAGLAGHRIADTWTGTRLVRAHRR